MKSESAVTEAESRRLSACHGDTGEPPARLASGGSVRASSGRALAALPPTASLLLAPGRAAGRVNTSESSAPRAAGPGATTAATARTLPGPPAAAASARQPRLPPPWLRLPPTPRRSRRLRATPPPSPMTRTSLPQPPSTARHAASPPPCRSESEPALVLGSGPEIGPRLGRVSELFAGRFSGPVRHWVRNTEYLVIGRVSGPGLGRISGRQISPSTPT
jgi:hypothetical protein